MAACSFSYTLQAYIEIFVITCLLIWYRRSKLYSFFLNTLYSYSVGLHWRRALKRVEGAAVHDWFGWQSENTHGPVMHNADEVLCRRACTMTDLFGIVVTHSRLTVNCSVCVQLITDRPTVCDVGYTSIGSLICVASSSASATTDWFHLCLGQVTIRKTKIVCRAVTEAQTEAQVDQYVPLPLIGTQTHKKENIIRQASTPQHMWFQTHDGLRAARKAKCSSRLALCNAENTKITKLWWGLAFYWFMRMLKYEKWPYCCLWDGTDAHRIRMGKKTPTIMVN